MDAVYLQNRYTRLFNIRLRKSVHYTSGRRLVFANTADARGFYHSFSPDKKSTLQKLCRATSPSAVVAALQRGQLKVYLPHGAETVGISRLRTAIRPVLAAIIAHEKTDAMAFFLVRSKDAGNVGAVHERLHRLLRTQLETSWYKCWEDPRAWHGRLRDRLEAVEYKMVVEALGFDADRVPVTMFAEAYEVALLIGDHDETRVALECFLRGYSRFQHGLNTTQFTGGALFDIILTAVLVRLTGRAGLAGTVTGRQPPVVRSLTRLGGLLQDLAEELKHVKLLGPGKPQQVVAVAIPSTLADYVIEEKVPKPNEPPRSARVDTATVPPGKDVPDSLGNTSRGFRSSTDIISLTDETLYLSGTKQAQAQRLLSDTTGGIGIKLDGYVDQVVYTDGKASFFNVIDGKRTIAISDSSLDKNSFGQFIDAAHEFNHARHSRRLGAGYYDELYFDVAGMARIETLVETRALNQARKFYGDSLPSSIVQESLDYIKSWEKYLGGFVE